MDKDSSVIIAIFAVTVGIAVIFGLEGYQAIKHENNSLDLFCRYQGYERSSHDMAQTIEVDGVRYVRCYDERVINGQLVIVKEYIVLNEIVSSSTKDKGVKD